MGKKRIAKHVQESQERQRKEALEASTSADGSNVTIGKEPPKKKRRKKKKQQIKDPKEAHNYLSLWQQQQKLKTDGGEEDGDNKDNSGGVILWRFNTNTQSWLLRHMYNIEKVPKATFTILMSYLEALKGGSRQRVHEDAIRRALRYKNWEKKEQSGDGKKDNNDDDGTEEAKKATTKNSEEDGSDDDDDKDAEDNDEKLWDSLDGHDKRKEYKRARKVLDLFKVETQEKAE